MAFTGITLTPGTRPANGVLVPTGGVKDSQIVGNASHDNGANGILLRRATTGTKCATT